ncbi:MAG: MarR family winged helix-turn-helix transcriptional regulator [Desulfovibrio sp.]|jgi:DNA-binding MarR family transcriptional regulator|nr:MarR family winged helix-turn-helix transcriptional regulator [Desulfovibrio sp.]
MFEDKFSGCYCAATRKASRILTNFYDAAIAPSGLKITQYSLLKTLQRLGPVPIAALAEDMLLERTTLVRNLKILSQKALVEIFPDKQPRARLIRLTDKGEEELARAIPLWRQAQEQTRSVLTEEEQTMLGRLAQKLSAKAATPCPNCPK